MSYLLATALLPNWCRFSEDRLNEMGISSVPKGEDGHIGLDDFTQKVCRAYKVSAERSTNFRQISPGKAWQISAASLIVDNADLDNWCWANPDNIFLLEFWKDFDELCRFILVYGSYETFLGAQDGFSDLSPKKQSALQNRWQEYHTEMLRFFHDNRDRCLLLDVQSFESQASDIAKLLQSKFDINARMINTEASLEDNPIIALAAYNYSAQLPKSEVDDIVNELDNSADLQSDTQQRISDLSESAVKKYSSMEAKNTKLQKKLTKEKKKKRVAEAKLAELTQAHKDLVELQAATSKKQTAEARNFESQLSTIKAELGAARDKQQKDKFANEALAAENNLLLSQLHQVQEELERYFKNSLALEEKLKAAKADSDLNKQNVAQPSKTPVKQKPPEKVTVQFPNFINGTGWQNAEENGRWAGPSENSTVKIRHLQPVNYQLEVRILDGMSIDMIQNLDVFMNDQKLKISVQKLCDMGGFLAPIRRLKAGLLSTEKPYPILVTATVPKKFIVSDKKEQEVKFSVPYVKSPASGGSSDTRMLSLFYETLTLKPL